MKYYINGVVCDTYAHLDARRAGETVEVSASNQSSQTIVAFLYCNKKEFPVDQEDGLNASCCVRHNDGLADVPCNIGSSGEIIIPLPQGLCVEGNHLSCEINIAMTSGADQFIYRAFRFIAVVVK